MVLFRSRANSISLCAAALGCVAASLRSASIPHWVSVCTVWFGFGFPFGPSDWFGFGFAPLFAWVLNRLGGPVPWSADPVPWLLGWLSGRNRFANLRNILGTEKWPKTSKSFMVSSKKQMCGLLWYSGGVCTWRRGNVAVGRTSYRSSHRNATRSTHSTLWYRRSTLWW